MIKGVFVFIVLGLFFVLVGFYIFENFSPFEISKIDEIIKSNNISRDTPELLDEEINDIVNKGLVLDLISSNAILVLGVISAVILCFFTAIHLFVDKVFFKSIWEKPSLFNALRRSSLVAISFSLIIYLRVLNTEPITLILIPITSVVIEVMFNNIKVDFNKLFKKSSLETHSAAVEIAKDQVDDDITSSDTFH